MYTVPNGNIVRSLNLSKDWARAVVDVPVPTSADLNRVNDLLHEVCSDAMDDDDLRKLLLDKPALMGVESIEVDTVNLRIVARTLPGKQFDVGRRLRVMVIAALASAGISTPGADTPTLGAIAHPATSDAATSGASPGATVMRNLFRKWKREDHGWPKYLPGGRIRTSTVALAIAFVALFWVYQNYQPPPKPSPAQVVPPGFIPDPSYTWVPRTDVRGRTTTTTTTPTTTETTTTSPGESTTPGESPTSPTSPTSPATDHADDGGASAAQCTDPVAADDPGRWSGTDVDTRGADAVARLCTRPPRWIVRLLLRPRRGLHRRRTATLACRDDHP